MQSSTLAAFKLVPRIQIELSQAIVVPRPSEESTINILLKAPPPKCDCHTILPVNSTLPRIIHELGLNSLQVRLRQVREETGSENLAWSGRVSCIAELGKVTVLPESVLGKLGVLGQRA